MLQISQGGLMNIPIFNTNNEVVDYLDIFTEEWTEEELVQIGRTKLILPVVEEE